jgi:hypothetical protein
VHVAVEQLAHSVRATGMAPCEARIRNEAVIVPRRAGKLRFQISRALPGDGVSPGGSGRTGPPKVMPDDKHLLPHLLCPDHESPPDLGR